MVRKSKRREALLPVGKLNNQVPRAPTFVLHGTDTEGLFDRELRGVELTGILRQRQAARTCNIIESTLHSFVAESVSFTHCDFKDNAIRASRFLDCSFGSSTFAYNTVVNSTFVGCSFPDTDLQNCEFEQTSFVRCDIRNLLVKGCSFNRCEFRACQTSNKVFETCRLTECSFFDIELQVHTIAENFGLTASHFHGILRDDRPHNPYRKLSANELKAWITDDTTHPLQKLSVYYFLNETLLEGSPYLDTCLNLTSWLPAFRTAGSFAVVLNRWTEFLMWLYERDQLTIHTLILLHSMTDGLLHALEGRSSHHQAITTINGVHLSLARYIDQYLILLEGCVASASQEMSFLVEGRRTHAYYYRELTPLFERAPARIIRLVKHNSPWDLGISFASGTSTVLFMALFLATRTRIELSRIGQKLQDHVSDMPPPEPSSAKASGKRRRNATPGTESILSLEFGGNRVLRSNPNFRLKAYLPGNLVAELQLDVSSQKIARLRKTVKGML